MQFKQVKCRGVTYKNMSPSGEADTFKLYPVEGTRSPIWGRGLYWIRVHGRLAFILGPQAIKRHKIHVYWGP